LQGCALPLLSTVARCGDDPHGRTTAYLQAFLAGRPHVAAATGRRPKTSTFAPTPPRIAEVPLICPDKPACLSQCAALHRCPSSFALVYHSHSSSSAAQARRPRPRTSPPCRSSARMRQIRNSGTSGETSGRSAVALFLVGTCGLCGGSGRWRLLGDLLELDRVAVLVQVTGAQGQLRAEVRLNRESRPWSRALPARDLAAGGGGEQLFVE
jgi:hypothetical protein